MQFTPRKLNLFSLIKLPSAYFCGVRVKSITDSKSVASVKHRWISQNPFKSMFWAVQGMAAELSTGILVLKNIHSSGKKFSMLVTNMNATFTKKATGRITFTCTDGDKINEALQRSISTGEGQTIIMTSVGQNEEGQVVSKFEFEWSVKVKS